MADLLVVLDNVLSFLLARYRKTAIKQLKAAVLDFYSTEDICCAEENVLCAVKSLKSEINHLKTILTLHCHWHVILGYCTEFHLSQTILGGVTTSYHFSSWRSSSMLDLI